MPLWNNLVIDVCETMERLGAGHADAEKMMSLVGLLSSATAEPDCHAVVNIHCHDVKCPVCGMLK